MFRLIWITSIHLAGFLRRWMPTNMLLDRIRTRRGLKWGVPAMLLAIPYLYLASLLTLIIQDGGPGWLNLIVLLAIWSALKMLWIGPVSLVMLAKVRWQERRLHRAAQRRDTHQQSPDYAQMPAMAEVHHDTGSYLPAQRDRQPGTDPTTRSLQKPRAVHEAARTPTRALPATGTAAP